MTTQGQPVPFAAHVEAFDLHVQYEERAAILEYDAGWLRREAERLAYAEVYGRRPDQHRSSRP